MKFNWFVPSILIPVMLVAVGCDRSSDRVHSTPPAESESPSIKTVAEPASDVGIDDFDETEPSALEADMASTGVAGMQLEADVGELVKAEEGNDEGASGGLALSFGEFVEQTGIYPSIHFDSSEDFVDPELSIPAILGVLAGEGEMLIRTGQFDSLKACVDQMLGLLAILTKAPGFPDRLAEAADELKNMPTEPSAELWVRRVSSRKETPENEVPSIVNSLGSEELAARFQWGLVVGKFRFSDWIQTKGEAGVPAEIIDSLGWWLDGGEEMKNYLVEIRSKAGMRDSPTKSFFEAGIEVVAGGSAAKGLGYELADSEIRRFVAAAIRGDEAGPDENAGSPDEGPPARHDDTEALLATTASEEKILAASSEIAGKLGDGGGYRVFPDPIDKIMQFSGVLPDGVTAKAYWVGHFNRCAVDIKPEAYSDTEVLMPILFGIRMVDGFFAVQCEDANALRKVADDLRVMGRKLGGSEEDLQRAETIPRLAESGQWVKVVTELSFLREDVLRILKSDRYTTKRDLVLLGGWSQTARYVCPAVVEVVKREPQRYGRFSSILREPLVVAETIAGLRKLNVQGEQRGYLMKGLEFLNFAFGVVDIPPREPVKSLDDLDKLADMSSAFVNFCVNSPQTKTK